MGTHRKPGPAWVGWQGRTIFISMGVIAAAVLASVTEWVTGVVR